MEAALAAEQATHEETRRQLVEREETHGETRRQLAEREEMHGKTRRQLAKTERASTAAAEAVDAAEAHAAELQRSSGVIAKLEAEAFAGRESAVASKDREDALRRLDEDRFY